METVMDTTDALIRNMHWAATHAEAIASIPGVFDIGVTRFCVSILARGDNTTVAALRLVGETDGPAVTERTSHSASRGADRIDYTTTAGVPVRCTVFGPTPTEETA